MGELMYKLRKVGMQFLSHHHTDSSGSESDSACEIQPPTNPTKMTKFQCEKFVPNECVLPYLDRHEPSKSPTQSLGLFANLAPIVEENTTDSEFEGHSDSELDHEDMHVHGSEYKRSMFIRNSLAMRTHGRQLHFVPTHRQGHKEVEEDRFKFRSNLRDCRKRASVSCIVEAN